MSCADCIEYSELMVTDRGQKVCPECYRKRYYRKVTPFVTIAPEKKKTERELMLDLKRYFEKDF